MYISRLKVSICFILLQLNGSIFVWFNFLINRRPFSLFSFLLIPMFPPAPSECSTNQQSSYEITQSTDNSSGGGNTCNWFAILSISCYKKNKISTVSYRYTWTHLLRKSCSYSSYITWDSLNTHLGPRSSTKIINAFVVVCKIILHNYVVELIYDGYSLQYNYS